MSHACITTTTATYVLSLLLLFCTSNIFVHCSDTPLMQAAKRGDLEGVQENLLYIAETDSDNFSALTFATFSTQFSTSSSIVKLLIDSGEKVNHVDKNGYTPLLWAAQNNNMPAAIALIEAQANIEPQSIDQHLTPLLAAVVNHNLEMAEYLLTEGKANVNARTSNRVTSLISAVSGGDKNRKTLELLINNGAAINHYTKDLKISAAMIASQENYIELLELLLNSDADVDQKNKMGATALMMAATNGHYDIVQMLLDHGADPKISIKIDTEEDFERGTISRITALTMATSYGHQEISDLIERYLEL